MVCRRPNPYARTVFCYTNDQTPNHLSSPSLPQLSDLFRFKIDSSGGQITVAAIIDREDTCGEEYHLLAIAEDNAVDQTRRTTAEVTVHILDENDNSPTFSHTSYSTSITEESFHPDFITVTVRIPYFNA